MSRADFLFSEGGVTISRLSLNEMTIISQKLFSYPRRINTSAIYISFDKFRPKKEVMKMLIYDLNIGSPEAKLAVMLDISAGLL